MPFSHFRSPNPVFRASLLLDAGNDRKGLRSAWLAQSIEHETLQGSLHATNGVLNILQAEHQRESHICPKSFGLGAHIKSIFLAHPGAQPVKCPTIAFAPGPDLTIHEFEPRVRLLADSTEPAWDSISLSSLCPFPIFSRPPPK